MIAGIALILLTWSCLALMMGGLGRLFVWLGRLGPAKEWPSGDLIWLGWGILILVLQLWHLLLPVNQWALVLVIMLGALGWFFARPQRGDSKDVSPYLLGGFSAVAIVYILWLANRASGSIAGVGDAGLYHVGMIRWLTEAPIVPGLGNLHGRFAFNNSSFLYHALLEVGPLAGRSFHVAGSFLLLVSGLSLLWAMVRIAVTPAATRSDDWLQAILFGFVLHLSFVYGTSTSPDLPIALLTIVIGIRLFRLLFVSTGTSTMAQDLVFIGTLSAAGVTIKLSFLMFGLLATLFALLRYWQLSSMSVNQFFRSPPVWIVGAAAMLFILPWIGRNVMLSGYVLYPGVPWSIDVSWRVPTAQMVDEARWIRSWARLPWSHHSEVLHSRAWLGPWLQAALLLRVEVALPLILSAIAWIGLLVRRPRELQRMALGPWLGTLFGALLFWFVAAPAIRFAGGVLWLFAASGIALLLVGLSPRVLRMFAYAFMVLALAIGSYNARALGIVVPHGSDLLGLHPMPSVEVTSFSTNGGAQLYVPLSGYSCWAAPLPCTPYPSVTLNTLEPDDWRSGFVQSHNQVQIDWPPSRE